MPYSTTATAAQVKITETAKILMFISNEKTPEIFFTRFHSMSRKRHIHLFFHND